ncbi:MAG: hypothetical protein LLF90_03150 [Methanomicrobiaceae archaeon]|uniref:hypothetical protein n=1 Tax=Methanoculleus sp. TaxID=90427 RepID=UPI00320DDD1B|nr:hypothetical protein [Methanomicrobiaceae archaeon]
MKILEIGGCCAGVPHILADALHTKHVQWIPPPQGYASTDEITLQGPGITAFEIEQRLRHTGKFLNIIRDYDVLHFHYRTFLPMFLDVPLWRSLGKEVIVHFHGDDIRGHFLKAKNPLLSLAKVYVSTPDLLDTVPFADWLPNPVPKVSSIPELQHVFKNEIPVLLHAPTDRVRKGTDIILQAVDIAQNDGCKFEFRLIENRPREEVLREIARSDIVIDQVGTGMYGMISIEAMMCRKPVICHIEDRFHGLCKDCPIYKVDPTSISVASAIHNLLDNPEMLKDLGRRGEQYVHEVHSVENVVRRIKQLGMI